MTKTNSPYSVPRSRSIRLAFRAEERSASRQSGATLATVMATGDTLLGLGRPADAETFYTKALSMPSADTAMVSTRLGIAQFDQGKFAEAEATFEKVEGPRAPIANLWAIYATQQGGSATM